MEKWRAENKSWDEEWGRPSGYRFETASPVEELRDELFAKCMLSFQKNGQISADYSSDSSDPDLLKVSARIWKLGTIRKIFRDPQSAISSGL